MPEYKLLNDSEQYYWTTNDIDQIICSSLMGLRAGNLYEIIIYFKVSYSVTGSTVNK